ncbi:MAG TPA: sigma-70 family RNA polymerase sigma factor [Bryobacteraceae bacterium]|nr:sigma-70 family RNA polymerase sigma factor [Bryobacteraceae bacterium]
MVLEKTERELIDACQSGDREAFGCLFEIHRKRMFSIALRFSGDNSVAMDIVQDTFLKLLSSIGDFRGVSEFEAWMYRLVANRCIDHLRRAHRLIPLTDVFTGALRGAADSVADLLRAELQHRVRWAVGRLSPDQRMVIVMRYADELSYDEIAAALGCSPGTVASRLNRAHKILHRRLAHMAGSKPKEFPPTRRPERGDRHQHNASA